MPQRKHHKLLKDGSGNEVWPEFVEQIFVNGLRAYTASTVSQNHTTKLSDAAVPGRSRLRNAFLVQYLTERGIKRSRKQVASHLQVLKNMWRADGNYSGKYIYAYKGIQHFRMKTSLNFDQQVYKWCCLAVC
ncbi:hypothetical protein J3R30DRAFT_3432646 [Lentinula aciculospora]|uniref:TEA domain-containing protein n=1 Tax=Lentinula aciculospora TaxID=153920 RepID=A0A9W9AQ87_9AGAR|nr:hypothetical protein J3R30DRAFT_3432646 [Lentinula aciculospora]